MDFLKEAFKVDPAKTWAEEIQLWKKSAADARTRETNLQVRIAELDYEKSQLELKVVALVRLLIKTNLIDASKLEAMMTAIDGEDGTTDGRVTPGGSHRTPFVPVTPADPA